MYYWYSFIVQISLSPSKGKHISWDSSWDSLATTTTSWGALPLSGCQDTSVNPWVFYSKRGKDGERKTAFAFGGVVTNPEMSLLSLLRCSLWVLHLTNIYRIFALGLGTWRPRKPDNKSLVLQDVHANDLLSDAWGGPGLPAWTLLQFVCNCISTICRPKPWLLSWTVPPPSALTSMISVLLWLAQHQGQCENMDDVAPDQVGLRYLLTVNKMARGCKHHLLFHPINTPGGGNTLNQFTPKLQWLTRHTEMGVEWRRRKKKLSCLIGWGEKQRGQRNQNKA